MLVSEALWIRKSVREFLNKEIPQDKIMTLLDLARYTASGTNTQPWQIAVVSGESKRQLEQKFLRVQGF